MLKKWFKLSTKHVHVVRGLRLEVPYDKSPCLSGERSRWLKGQDSSACAKATSVDDKTKATVAAALEAAASTDTNPYMRDIIASNYGEVCSTKADTVGMSVDVKGTCWTHVHSDLYSIYDFTYWTLEHPGNEDKIMQGTRNPISMWAEIGSAEIWFPSYNHPMTRWQTAIKPIGGLHRIPFVGRLGDFIDFSALPTGLQTLAMSNELNATSSDGQSGFEACGSPGEVANVPTKGNHYYFLSDQIVNFQEKYEAEINHIYPSREGKQMVWTNVVLKAKDQLRQRVAWALSQIFVAANAGVAGREDDYAPWLSYYDIFVRNGFGSFKTILREVSYHAIMNHYLTYIQNKAYNFAKTYPDENYAREIMQLFTIGLWQLNMDGTRVLDKNGQPVATYDNDDVMSFAKVWTGTDRQTSRGNMESKTGIGAGNLVDPVQLKPQWRDYFPKTSLGTGYLGDGYPLCLEMPSRAFLSRGAKYKYTKQTPIEGESYSSRPRFIPKKTSALYKALCARGSELDSNCTFPSEVVLTDSLSCDGQECEIDHIRMVTIEQHDQKHYFTYEPPACVTLTWFEGGMLTRMDEYSSASQSSEVDCRQGCSQCANPKSFSAAGAYCCNADNNVIVRTGAECLFRMESMTHQTAQTRCSSAHKDRGGRLCTGHKDLSGTKWKSASCADRQFSWTSESCKLQVQVHSTGYVNLVSPSDSYPRMAIHSGNVFMVRWEEGKYPTIRNGGCEATEGCSKEPGGTCVCDIKVKTKAVYDNTLSTLPDIATMRKTLFIGASDPSIYPTGTYSKCVTALCKSAAGVTVHTKGDATTIDADTIFELSAQPGVGRRARFLLNRASDVQLGAEYAFRNPPNFMPLAGEKYYGKSGFTANFREPQSHHEIEAVLEHLFTHPNTPPFISYRLIQRMVTSNPSPQYVRAVATAFSTGKYGGRTYSGEYGDLRATIAAILLDPEARHTILDSDPNFGVLREPLLKVLHVFRALEYHAVESREVAFGGMELVIGQQAFMSPTVFNFYLVEYMPPGPIGAASLHAPEAQLLTAPLVVGYLNGMVSLVDHGLLQYGSDKCPNGFGVQRYSCDPDGHLSYKPTQPTDAATTIGELSLLLTAGRVSKERRAVIAAAYDAERLKSNAETALKRALKLFIMASEFHASNLVQGKGSKRPMSTPQVSRGREYKALVVLFLKGGADSFNLLVPHSECSAHDLHKEYTKVRGEIAINKLDLLEIKPRLKTQPCDVFGLNPVMPNLKRLYDAGDAAMIANMGALVEPVTKQEYKDKAKRLPPSLFAHNIQQKVMASVWAQYGSAEGVLGRIMSSLSGGRHEAPYKVGLYSLDGNQKLLEGSAPPSFIDPKSGVERFDQYGALKDDIHRLSSNESHSLFAETAASQLEATLAGTESLGERLQSTTLATDEEAFKATNIGKQFLQVAKLIKVDKADLEMERSGFVTALGGFDTHNTDEKYDLHMADIDAALGLFEAEMKAQGTWDAVTVVTVSDFGRTLTFNGLGTDHAWGGNYFVAGGNVSGTQIHGR